VGALRQLWDITEELNGAPTEVFIIMTCFTDRYHDILYS
jgi:hypothetical protein